MSNSWDEMRRAKEDGYFFMKDKEAARKLKLKLEGRSKLEGQVEAEASVTEDRIPDFKAAETLRSFRVSKS